MISELNVDHYRTLSPHSRQSAAVCAHQQHTSAKDVAFMSSVARVTS
jgi:hypothetical protein